MRRVLAATNRIERLLFAGIVVGYVVLAVGLWQGKDFSKKGPLAYASPEVTKEQFGLLGVKPERVERDCFAGETKYGDKVKFVTAEIEKRRVFACYDVDSEDQSVEGVHVVDADGERVRDPHVLKPAGVWPHYAVVKSADELALGALGLVVFLSFGFFVPTRRRLGPPPNDMPWWGNGLVLGVLTVVPVIGWIAVAVLPRVPRARKSRFVMWGVVGTGLLFGFVLLSDAFTRHDPWGKAVVSYISLATVAAAVVGVRARPRLVGLERGPLAASTSAPAAQPGPSPSGVFAGPAGSAGSAGSAPVASAPVVDLVRVQKPDRLPTYGDVGGLSSLKKELRETVDLVLAFSDHADAYRIRWNGILLHGLPGTGKTFVVQATAGEFGLNLLHVAAGDLVSSFRGESARNVDAVFRLAMRNIPAILFFDEFDSVALRRDDNPDQEARRTVNQLLQSLESTRSVRELIVMAATNDLGSLDPAVIRAGRFDRHIHVPLPDREARASILRAQLAGRPGGESVDVEELARRTEGLTPATLAQVVSAASMTAMREAAGGASLVPLSTERLVDAVKSRGGKDRPTIENWSWDKLVLPPRVKAELRQVAALAADPDRASRFGVDPPSGVLLYGPPGTGKTTIARVLAAEANCSFYAVSAADLTSKWLGESERLISQLFARARENRPSIIFIDEIDAIAGTRGGWGTYDKQVNQLLQEMDGVESSPGVVVVGATNRKDMLDPAVLRGGRLSRHLEIPLPDAEGRRELLALFTDGMPVSGVDLDALAARTAGMSGADLEALCQEAGMQAIIRCAGSDEATVTSADFAAALSSRVASKGDAPKKAPGRGADEGYI